MVATNLVYLLACVPLILVFLLFFLLRPDLRKEMLFTGVLIGCLSVVTAYNWWTKDWWHPATIMGTRVGLEDFISGFASGGIMAVGYEFFFQKRLYKIRPEARHLGGVTILLLLACLTSWLFWGIGLTSFYASAIAMTIVALVLFWNRQDLIIDGLMSGILMAAISTLSYLTIIYASPTWIAQTYDFHFLSGIFIGGVPIEEYIFWFLAGVLFGPFYEYIKSDSLRRIPTGHF